MSSALILLNFLILFDGLSSVSSNYFVYTYNDHGAENQEHCCLVRQHDDFCMATPLTRRLIQLDEKSQGSNAYTKYKNTFDRVNRRLNVENIHRIGKKTLLELKEPLEESILQRDLLCLSAQNNNFNLEKCFLELRNHTVKENKARKSRKTKSNETREQSDEEKKEITTRQVEISLPIIINPGRGLSIIQQYSLNISNIRTNNRAQQKCWNWYRQQTKNLCRNPQKYQRVCIELTESREKCVEELVDEKSIDKEQQNSFTSIPLNKHSKLYCENNHHINKMLGSYRRSELCFQHNYKISIEHQFTDIVHLADRRQNRDVLAFMANHTEIKKDFQHDCHDTHTLADIMKVVDSADETNDPADPNASNQEL